MKSQLYTRLLKSWDVDDSSDTESDIDDDLPNSPKKKTVAITVSNISLLLLGTALVLSNALWVIVQCFKEPNSRLYYRMLHIDSAESLISLTISYLVEQANGSYVEENTRIEIKALPPGYLDDNMTISNHYWANLFPRKSWTLFSCHLDRSWPKLKAGDGAVTIPKSWASAQNLPPSIQSPEEPDDYVYIMAGLHQLHCLVSKNKPETPAYIYWWHYSNRVICDLQLFPFRQTRTFQSPARLFGATLDTAWMHYDSG